MSIYSSKFCDSEFRDGRERRIESMSPFRLLSRSEIELFLKSFSEQIKKKT